MDAKCVYLLNDCLKALLFLIRQPERAANLINAQATNLDILDVRTPLFGTSRMDMIPIAWQVIALTPSDWSLNMITPFLSRSFRRILHSEKEGKIVKNISAAQNLEVTPFIFTPLFQFPFIGHA